MRPQHLSDAEVVERFGDPAPYVDGDGAVSSAWGLTILDSFPLPAKLPLSWDRSQSARTVRCHKLILPHLRAALEDLYRVPQVWKSINDFGGCYQFRRTSRGKKLSRHSWGIAIDLDVMDNPQGLWAFLRDPKMHPYVVKVFEKHGFYWGGWFSTPDPMHFEWGTPKGESI